MKLLLASLLCLCLVVVLIPGWALGSVSNEDISKIDAQVDSYFKKSSTVGGSLVIAKNGEIVYQRDYGFQNKDQKAPVTEDTYFRIASITKMVSAIGIMQLREQGLLDLDQDISKYFGYEIVNPNFPKIPITLRQCMSHTTSLSQNGGYSFESRTIHELLAKEVRHFSNFTEEKPGDHYSYSNFGAGLMGSIMEAVTGVSVNQYMTDHVFKPLNIDAAYSAGFLTKPDCIANQYENGKMFKSASKYLKEKYEDFADPERHYRITVGDIFMRSKDLAKIASVLCGDGSFDGTQLLTKESIEMMRTDQREFDASVTGESPYGLCVNLMGNMIKDHMIYGHQGMANGAMCNVFYDPETQFVLVMLTNGCSQVRQDRIGVLPRRLFTYTYPLFNQE
jgi:CubicO group peptidase (beta-lactamase class C family)